MNKILKLYRLPLKRCKLRFPIDLQSPTKLYKYKSFCMLSIWTGIAEVMGSNAVFSGLIFTTSSVVSITARIASLFDKSFCLFVSLVHFFCFLFVFFLKHTPIQLSHGAKLFDRWVCCLSFFRKHLPTQAFPWLTLMSSTATNPSWLGLFIPSI